MWKNDFLTRSRSRLPLSFKHRTCYMAFLFTCLTKDNEKGIWMRIFNKMGLILNSWMMIIICIWSYLATSVSKIVGMCLVGKTPVLKTVNRLVLPHAPSPTMTSWKTERLITNKLVHSSRGDACFYLVSTESSYNSSSSFFWLGLLMAGTLGVFATHVGT